MSHGIDTGHIAPLDVNLILGAVRRLSQRLKQGRESMIQQLADEVNEDYLVGVRKSIVSFVMQDPRSLQFEQEVGRQSSTDDLTTLAD